jgi:branched-subunit amino acid aminotransferase/4-amino-4-deoxychorismate lyase
MRFMNQQPLAFLNGRFVPLSQAVLPVYDAGFVLGATVSEQMRTFGGRLFRLEEHLTRLSRSLKIVGVVPQISLEQLGEAAHALVAKNHPLLAHGDDLGLSVFITPGPYPTLSGGDASGPTVGLHTYPLPFSLWAEKYQRGECLAVTEIEQVSARSWPVELKCRSRMHYYLADQRARAMRPPARALLIDERGDVCETSTANLLLHVRGAGLVSPPRESILPGITLAATLELAAAAGISCSERAIKPTLVAAADEVLLTSTPNCLLPVTRFNGAAIAAGKPGPVFERLLCAWNDSVGLDIAAQAREFAGR